MIVQEVKVEEVYKTSGAELKMRGKWVGGWIPNIDFNSLLLMLNLGC